MTNEKLITENKKSAVNPSTIQRGCRFFNVANRDYSYTSNITKLQSYITICQFLLYYSFKIGHRPCSVRHRQVFLLPTSCSYRFEWRLLKQGVTIPGRRATHLCQTIILIRSFCYTHTLACDYSLRSIYYLFYDCDDNIIGVILEWGINFCQLLNLFKNCLTLDSQILQDKIASTRLIRIERTHVD